MIDRWKTCPPRYRVSISSPERDRARDQAADDERDAEEQLQGECAADDLGDVGGRRDDLGLAPVGQPGGRGSRWPITSGSDCP